MRAVQAIAELTAGPALVRGTVTQLAAGGLELPAFPPSLPGLPAPPSIDAIAIAVLDAEELQLLDRPHSERWERGRPFVLRDASGRALVRLGPPDAQRGPPPRPGEPDLRLPAGRVHDELSLRLDRPFIEWREGARSFYLRTVALGDEVVVAGRVRFEVAPDLALVGEAGGYREAPTVAVVEADAVFDGPAWASRAAWQALPWYRKLSLIVRNR